MKRIAVSMMMGALMLGGASNVLAQNEINERQQNLESKRIYKQKRDAQHQ